jgi:hypothetical protein
MLGARQLRFSLVTGGKDGTRFPIRERVERFWNTLGEGIVLKVVFDHVEGVCRFENRLPHFRKHDVVSSNG